MPKSRKKSRTSGAPPASGKTAVPSGNKTVLHLFSGSKAEAGKRLHRHFHESPWHALRMDPNPAAEPDITGGFEALAGMPGNHVDGIWCAHRLKHLYFHETDPILKQCFRILRPGGILLLAEPDLQQAADVISLNGRYEDPLFESKAGPIAPADILFGHRASIARGKTEMAHHSGFIATSLGRHLRSAGFTNVRVQRDYKHRELLADAYKLPPGAPKRRDKIMIVDHRSPRMTDGRGNAVLADELDVEPQLWRGFPPKSG